MKSILMEFKPRGPNYHLPTSVMEVTGTKI